MVEKHFSVSKQKTVLSEIQLPYENHFGAWTPVQLGFYCNKHCGHKQLDEERV